MHRFFVTQPQFKGKLLELSGDEWHHCRNVLRGQKGDRLTLFDGTGHEYLVEIVEAGTKQATLRLLQQTNTPPPPCHISLIQALPKNRAMDFIIQKATELGVREIMPVFSERSVIRLDPEETADRIARWKEISIESAKQCGLDWLPQIHPIREIRDVIGSRPQYGRAFIGSLQPDARPLWEYTDSKMAGEKVLMMIGPEGDFTPAEFALARSSGFQPLSLGPLVLRCDTAAVYALSTLSHEMRRLEKT